MQKLRILFKNHPSIAWLATNVIILCCFWLFIFVPNVLNGRYDWSDIQYFFPGVGAVALTMIINTFVWWIIWRQLTHRQGYVRQAFTKHRWLYLVVTNTSLFGFSWLMGALTFGVAISEDYHPDSYARSLLPTAGVLFGVFGVAFILSLLWWIKYRTATPKRCLLLGVVAVAVAVIAGTVMYWSTENKPETRTYEFLGNTYEIPREYSPSMHTNRLSGKATLSIDVCGNAPLVGAYDRLAKQALSGSCEQGTHMIQPLVNGLPSFFDFVLKMSFEDGRHGFTVATSTDGVFLNPINPSDLDGTRTELITTDDMTIITSRDGGLHKGNYYLEFVDNKLQWVTVCGLWNCQNHSAYPGEFGYWLRVDAYNRAQYERGYLTDEEVAEFKQISGEVYDLFNSFKVE
jgi:hypothetical protein